MGLEHELKYDLLKSGKLHLTQEFMNALIESNPDKYKKFEGLPSQTDYEDKKIRELEFRDILIDDIEQKGEQYEQRYLSIDDGRKLLEKFKSIESLESLLLEVNSKKKEYIEDPLNIEPFVRTYRIRRVGNREENWEYFITIKAENNHEFEYPCQGKEDKKIPTEVLEEWWNQAESHLEKYRWNIAWNDTRKKDGTFKTPIERKIEIDWLYNNKEIVLEVELDELNEEEKPQPSKEEIERIKNEQVDLAKPTKESMHMRAREMLPIGITD